MQLQVLDATASKRRAHYRHSDDRWSATPAVVEVKGQSHRELFTAASAQLHERYRSHPDASQQRIYLVRWFGPGESLAGRWTHEVKSAAELKNNLPMLPKQLK
ncbi:hypothetical protein [Tianweitania sediminis]|uniref:Uncharacterized protein n=1 Tax=Tianweitania sediminis TaxID=1502156 RepID=A0A8J7QYJ2_9HYPH|nr:hypothetical protein [Tianweitania sediminis]MBP0438320.1 hypothetical protein [Tianweitania sediminis]